MNRPVPILIGLALALAIGALVISQLSARPGVSMTLLEYRRWPHGAMLRLTNGTDRTIRYLAEHDGLPMGCPLLCVQKTSNGWSTASVTVRRSIFRDPITARTNEFLSLFDPAAPPKPGERIYSLLTRELKPGRSADFFVRVEPGAAPKRIGTVCIVPQSKLTAEFQPWLSRIRQWCRMKTTTVPGQVEVWCPESLCFASPRESGKGD
jgi:hypothetical protein